MTEPNTIKINEIEYVRKDSIKKSIHLPNQDGNAAYPYEVGKNYFIRTVTHYFTGTLLYVGPQELLLENTSWIADTGRFSDALKKGTLNEIEPYPEGPVIIGRGSIIDASPWNFGIVMVQK
jgi:hypothetical protein